MALALLHSMRSRRVLPDLVAYSSLLSACEKGRQWQRCLLLLSQMWTLGPAPDIVAYGAAVLWRINGRGFGQDPRPGPLFLNVFACMRLL